MHGSELKTCTGVCNNNNNNKNYEQFRKFKSNNDTIMKREMINGDGKESTILTDKSTYSNDNYKNNMSNTKNCNKISLLKNNEEMFKYKNDKEKCNDENNDIGDESHDDLYNDMYNDVYKNIHNDEYNNINNDIYNIYNDKRCDVDKVQTDKNDKNKKLKNVLSGISYQMKNAMNVFGEVKEHIKYTASEAKKNINYPFCKAPCNIENLRNTIFINEEEIVINKNIYKNIFNKKNIEKEQQEQNKKENEELFSCKKSDIIIKGNYNFDIDIEIVYANEQNKIVVHAYDKETKKKIPCTYKWTRVYYNKECELIEKNVYPHKNVILYDENENEYELTCEDIGTKIYVECSCINNEQINVENLSKFYINASTNSEGYCYEDGIIIDKKKMEHKNKYNNDYHQNNRNDYYDDHIGNDKYNNDSSGLSSLKHSIKKNNKCNEQEHSKNHLLEKKSMYSLQTCYNKNGKQKDNINNNNNNNNIYMYKEDTPIKDFSSDAYASNESYVLNKNASSILNKNSSSTTVSNNEKNTYNNKKYHGVAIGEIGPLNINEKTKKMLERIIENDTIRYPIYIIKKVYNDEETCNDFLNNDYMNKNKKDDRLKIYSDCNSLDSFTVNSNMESENDMDIYMLYIHKNEIKIIDHNNMSHMNNVNNNITSDIKSMNTIKKNMWTHKFHYIYPYVHFMGTKHKQNNQNDTFQLYINENEYYICKCLYKRHRDLIAIILRYMHANLYIINDYIFNNINQNFEKTRAKNIFENIDVNYILQNINKELLINRKITQKCYLKINKLQSEKNMLEEELKSTIQAFQSQLDNVKKFKDENDLIQTNEKLMKEIKILQEKYRNVDLFFKNKYKALISDIERYKKLLDENKSKVNEEELEKLQSKLKTLEKEKDNLLNENSQMFHIYNEEKKNKTELENKLKGLSIKLETLNNSLQEEKIQRNINFESLKEMEELKKHNKDLQQKNVKISDEMNLLITEKNRLTKLVDSLTKDIEKSKMNKNLKSTDKKTDIDQDKEKLLKEISSLKDENELLKKRIKKFAKISTITT
ncbi:hypothetical protein PGSY75_0717600 [Plasmodium gaboni]|uniref:Uncharacterized protein n=1 Tax=Plasmodium gaboni TaxID=647221 RepID=A0A151LQ42_9APIC|nr:hypothetical protein PGSY75_0717600 [Plasmodium gaboni]KYO01314.1 hypothetical protein PGSY75_0717600 [Plasmodium gaboni]